MADDLDQWLKSTSGASVIAPVNGAVVPTPADRLAESLDIGARRDPDKTAKLLPLAASQQLPLDTVERNYDEVKRRQLLDDLKPDEIVRDSPAVAAWLRDTENASLAYEEVPLLQQLEFLGKSLVSAVSYRLAGAGTGVVQAGAELPGALKRGVVDPQRKLPPGTKPLWLQQLEQSNPELAVQEFGRNAASVRYQLPAEPLPLIPPEPGSVAESMQEFRKKLELARSNYVPDSSEMPWLTRAAGGGVESLGMNIVPMLASILTGSPVPMIAGAGLTTGGTSYGTARDQGVSPGNSLGFAARDSTVEVVFELAPAIMLVKDLKAGTSAFKTIVRNQLLEQATEIPTTLVQNLNAWATLPENADKTGMDFLKEQPEAVLQTIVATLIGSGGQAAIMTGTRALSDKFTQSKIQQDQLQALIDLATDSKLRERSPERFDELMQSVVGNTVVWVTQDEVQKLTDAGVALPTTMQTQLDGKGHDVSVTLRDVLANPEIAAKLRKHIRTAPDGLTQEELKTQGKSAVQDMLARAAKGAIDLTEMEQIQKTAHDQLVSTGRYTSDEAIHAAAILPAYINRIVSDPRYASMTPAQVAAKMGYSITGPATQAPPAGTGEVLEQPGRRLLHVSGSADLTADTIDFNPRVTRQGRKGRYGGLYTYDNLEDIEAFRRGNHGDAASHVYEIEVASDARTYEMPAGGIERLDQAKLDELRAQGYSIVTGKSLTGKPETVVIDRKAIAGMRRQGDPSTRDEFNERRAAQLRDRYDPFLTMTDEEFKEQATEFLNDEIYTIDQTGDNIDAMALLPVIDRAKELGVEFDQVGARRVRERADEKLDVKHTYEQWWNIGRLRGLYSKLHRTTNDLERRRIQREIEKIESSGILNQAMHHGTPHTIDPLEGFSLKYMGTGEGASTSATGNVPSTTDEALSDATAINAEQFGQLAISSPLFVEGVRSLDVETRGRVFSVMRGLLNDRQIAHAVVRLVPVDVMDMLVGSKLGSVELLNDPTVLVDLLPTDANDTVTSSVQAVDVLAPYVALATAEKTGLSGTVVAMLRDGLAARVAVKGDLHASKIPQPSGKHKDGSPVTQAERDQVLEQSQPESKRVSTRVPTAVKATENALTDNLIVGLESSKADPVTFAKNAAEMRKYPNFPYSTVKASSPDTVVDTMLDQIVGNLLWLHDQMSADLRSRAKLWYEGARALATRWSDRFGLDDTQIAGVIAVLSPQRDWFQNVSLAERVLTTIADHGDTVWGAEMDATAARIFAKPEYEPLLAAARGKRLSEVEGLLPRALWVRAFDEAHNTGNFRILTPEGNFAGWQMTEKNERSNRAWGSLDQIAKAISIIDDGSRPNVSARLGGQHKVRNFYNNIIDPTSTAGDVTIDTHAVAAALLRPLAGGSKEVLQNFGGSGSSSSSVYGSKGTYGIYAEAYRRAAAQRGILPREMQSITWEAVRGLFESGAKKGLTDGIDNIWDNYRRGKETIDATRTAVSEAAGGISAPDWSKPAGAVDEAAGDSSYQGIVPDTGVPGGSTGSTARRGRSATAGSTGKLEQKTRGTFNRATRVINLTNASNESTFMHEAAHLFLDFEAQLAAEFGVSPQQQAMLDYLGVASFADITRDHHEQWAESFEAYLREGKAPSVGLRGAFSAFSRWLTRLYQSLGGLPNAKLTPELRGIFDRLLATEAEIARAAGTPLYDQFFRDQRSAGMTDKQWQSYLFKLIQVRNVASITLEEKVLKQYKAVRSAEWNAEREPMVEEELERLSKLPVYQIIGDISKGYPMDWKITLEILGIPKPTGRLIGKLKKDGIDPAEYAELHGYASTRKMLVDVLNAPGLKEAATAAAQARMVAKHGDILNDGTIEQEARDAMHNEAEAELIATEIAALKRDGREPDIDREYLRTEATRLIATYKYSEILPARFLAAEIRAAQATARSTKPEEQRAFKIQQLANHYLYREATEIKRQMESWRRYVRRVQTRAYDTKQVDPDYVQNMRVLAGMYDLRSDPEKVMALDGFLAWHASQVADPNQFVQVELLDPWLINAMALKAAKQPLTGVAIPTFDDLTVDQMHGLADQLRHLRFVGGMVAGADRNDLLADENELAVSILENGGNDFLDPGKVPRAPTRLTAWKRALLGYGYDLIDLRNMARKLDKNFDKTDTDGAAFRHIFQPTIEARDAELKSKERMYQAWQAELNNLHALGLNRNEQTIVMESGREWTTNARERVMLAAYWGTESSREAVRDGITATDRDVERMLATLTPDQLRMVNALWKLNESLWPEISASATLMYGVAPIKLDPVPFTVNGVAMTGGHMRLYYDSLDIELQEIQQQGASTMGVVPSRLGSTINRKGSGGKRVLLDTTNITRAYNEAFHFIAFAPVARRLKTMTRKNGPVRNAIVQKHGDEFMAAFIRNIDSIMAARPERETSAIVAKLAKYFRWTASLRSLVFSVKNSVQNIPNVLLGMDEVRPDRFMGAAMAIIARPAETIQKIHGLSQMMKNRGSLTSREASEFVHNLSLGNDLERKGSAVLSAGFALQKFTDAFAAYPTWWARYSEQIEKNPSDIKTAVQLADDAVSSSVGDGSDARLGYWFQSNRPQLLKMITQFGSWFNNQFNRMYRDTQGFSRSSLTSWRMYQSALILPALLGMLSAWIVGDGPDPDDDEAWWAWALKRWGGYMLAYLPILRDIGGQFKGMPSKGPLSPVGEGVKRTYTEIAQSLDDESPVETGLKKTSDVLKIAGTVAPLPGLGNVTHFLDYTDSYNQGMEGDVFNPYLAVVEGKSR